MSGYEWDKDSVKEGYISYENSNGERMWKDKINKLHMNMITMKAR